MKRDQLVDNKWCKMERCRTYFRYRTELPDGLGVGHEGKQGISNSQPIKISTWAVVTIY